MDTTAQNNQQPSDQTVQPPVQNNTQQTTSTPAPAVTPAGKESAPVVIPKPQEQWIEETAKEATVGAELQEVGVEAKKK